VKQWQTHAEVPAVASSCRVTMKCLQWRSQDLEVGAQGVCRGTEVPQRGPGAEPLVGGSGGA